MGQFDSSTDGALAKRRLFLFLVLLFFACPRLLAQQRRKLKARTPIPSQ